MKIPTAHFDVKRRTSNEDPTAFCRHDLREWLMLKPARIDRINADRSATRS